jgi:hypothetical protein
MISLGTCDASVTKDELAAYRARVKKMTGIVTLSAWDSQLRDEGKWVDYTTLAAGEPMKVAELQQFLRDAGFRPFGETNGICGYRTTAAIFLFQEYVRTIEGKADIGYPDGRFGKVSYAHVQRWRAGKLRADWAGTSGAEPSPEHAQMMKLLNAAKAHYLENPGPTQSKVNAAGACDTVKVADWEFDPDKIHIVGIRRRKAAAAVQNLDDPFKLLIHGQVFTFFGSTEPGTKEGSEPKYPYLVPGQHRYRLGWHHQGDGVKIFQALKPLGVGVLVQRSAGMIATDAELQGPLDPRFNQSINVHWGGGGASDNAAWSAGCQVVAGKSYSNHHAKVIDCSAFAANNYVGLGADNPKGVYQNKGAYTMLVSLVSALSGENADDNLIRYTLLTEPDLALDGEQFASQTVDLLQQLRTA